LLVNLEGNCADRGRNCIVPAQATSRPGSPPTHFYAKILPGASVLNVRTQWEWDQSPITGISLISQEQLQNRLSELPNNNIVLDCLIGVRCRGGVAIVKQSGFTNGNFVNGGLRFWLVAGCLIHGKTPSVLEMLKKVNRFSFSDINCLVCKYNFACQVSAVR
jgi:rhodanese-related sulfurtransferase